MTISFKNANQSDLPYIVDVYNQNIASRKVTADLEPVSVRDRMAWMQQSDPNSRPIWIILDDDDRAGWISLGSFYGRAAYQHTVEISIYIDAEFQHHGLGSAALHYAEQQAPELSIDTILAFIFSHNVPSQKLFKKNDYQQWGHLPGVADMDDQRYDLDILGKHLSNFEK